MTHNYDPGFSSDRILTEYVRLNEIDWGKDDEERFPVDDEQPETDWNGNFEGEGI